MVSSNDLIFDIRRLINKELNKLPQLSPKLPRRRERRRVEMKKEKKRLPKSNWDPSSVKANWFSVLPTSSPLGMILSSTSPISLEEKLTSESLV